MSLFTENIKFFLILIIFSCLAYFTYDKLKACSALMEQQQQTIDELTKHTMTSERNIEKLGKIVWAYNMECERSEEREEMEEREEREKPSYYETPESSKEEFCSKEDSKMKEDTSLTSVLAENVESHRETSVSYDSHSENEVEEEKEEIPRAMSTIFDDLNIIRFSNIDTRGEEVTEIEEIEEIEEQMKTNRELPEEILDVETLQVKDDKVYNPKTGRWVNKDGPTAKKIMEELN